jgi:hypothetical protein
VARRKSKTKKESTTPRKVGRPRKCFEFYEARELVRQENLSSVKQYEKWWKLNLPARIPKRPDRAYKNEWQGWNDFLGSTNPFPCVRKNFRSFKEARAFAHQLRFNTKAQWIEYAKSDKKPKDVPSRPDLVYREEWFTWKDFLGVDIPSVKRNIEETDAIFFIIKNSGRPNNVYQLGITMEGKRTIMDAQRQRGFDIVGLYYCDLSFGWKSIADECGREYWESGVKGEYMIPNISEFIFQIGDFVETLS